MRSQFILRLSLTHPPLVPLPRHSASVVGRGKRGPCPAAAAAVSSGSGQVDTTAPTSAPAALAGAGPQQSYRVAGLRFYFVIVIPPSSPRFFSPPLPKNFLPRPARHEAASSAHKATLGAAKGGEGRLGHFASTGDGRNRDPARGAPPLRASPSSGRERRSRRLGVTSRAPFSLPACRGGPRVSQGAELNRD